jgi:hypothetical protein
MMFRLSFRQNSLFLTLATGVSLALLVAGYYLWQAQNVALDQEITSFEECAAAGYPVMESYPEQCRVPGGASFTRTLSPQELNR